MYHFSRDRLRTCLPGMSLLSAQGVSCSPVHSGCLHFPHTCASRAEVTRNTLLWETTLLQSPFRPIEEVFMPSLLLQTMSDCLLMMGMHRLHGLQCRLL